MKRALALLLTITLLLPNITAKAAEPTQYIDVFIPSGLCPRYERGPQIYYDPDGFMENEWNDYIAGLPSEIPLVELGGNYSKDNPPLFHDGSVYGSTDFPYATMTYTVNGTKYTSIEDIKNNELSLRFTMPLETWNEINDGFEKVRQVINENVITDETGLIIDVKGNGFAETVTNNDIRKILRKYNSYYTGQQPRRTYYYGQHMDLDGPKDKFYTTLNHTFLSIYDWYINKNLCNGLPGTTYQDMSPIYYNIDCHATEVQPVGNHKHNITFEYYCQDCYKEYIYPEAISEPYTVENGEFHYNTELPYLLNEDGTWTEVTTEATTEATTTEVKTEVTTEVSTTEVKTEVTTEVPTTEVKTEVTTEVPTTEVKTEEPTTEVPTTEKPTEVPTVPKVEETTKVDDTVTISNVTYKISGKTATVVKSKNVKSVTIKNTIKYNGVEYKVTSINSNAFKNCTKLTSVTIDKNVKTINKHAFYNCKNLKKVTFKHDNKNLKKIKFKTNAFKNTHKKLKIVVSKNVTKATKKSFLKTIKKYGNKNVSYK